MILYSTGCPLCKTLETRMNQAGVSYTKITDEDEMINLGLQSVPAILKDGKILNFSEAMHLMDSIIKENAAHEDQHQTGP